MIVNPSKCIVTSSYRRRQDVLIRNRCGSSGGRSSLSLGSDLITIVEGKFWREADSEPVLQAINLHIKSGTVTLVAGPSGSGKTTLLDALLRELPPPSSSIQVSPGFDLRNGIAYCSQQPWLRNDTVRGNIVGNMPYDEAWYGSVLFACALGGVIHKLNQGLVGNGGATLSGGQKQRIVCLDPVRVAEHAANVVAGASPRGLLATATASSG